MGNALTCKTVTHINSADAAIEGGGGAVAVEEGSEHTRHLLIRISLVGLTIQPTRQCQREFNR